MTRLLASSHFPAWLSGAFTMLVLYNAAHGHWGAVAVYAVWSIVTAFVARQRAKEEAHE